MEVAAALFFCVGGVKEERISEDDLASFAGGDDSFSLSSSGESASRYLFLEYITK